MKFLVFRRKYRFSSDFVTPYLKNGRFIGFTEGRVVKRSVKRTFSRYFNRMKQENLN